MFVVKVICIMLSGCKPDNLPRGVIPITYSLAISVL